MYDPGSLYAEQPAGIPMPDLEHFAGSGVVHPEQVKSSSN